MKRCLLILIILVLFIAGTASAANLDFSRLLLYYPCDEGTGDMLIDAAGRGFDATLSGDSFAWEAGVFGSAIRLQKANSEVKGDIIGSTGETGEISIMCWVNMTAHTTYNGIVSIASPECEASCCYRIMINPAKNPFWNAGHHVDKSLADFAFELNKWYHYALIADGVTDKIYVDGVFIGEQAEDFALPSLPEVTVYVGTGETPSAWRIENAAVDEVMVWDKALTEEEIGMVMAERLTAVDLNGKLAGTWGNLKVR